MMKNNNHWNINGNFFEKFFLFKQERKIGRKLFVVRSFLITLLISLPLLISVFWYEQWSLFIVSVFPIVILFLLLLLPLQIVKRINDIGSWGWIASSIYQLIIVIYGIWSFATNGGWNFHSLGYVLIIFPASEVIFLFLLSVIPWKNIDI